MKPELLAAVTDSLTVIADGLETGDITPKLAAAGLRDLMAILTNDRRVAEKYLDPEDRPIEYMTFTIRDLRTF